jgi:hypothetical protein
MAIRDEGVIKFLHRERHTEVFGVSVPDVVNQALKKSV